MAAKQYFIMRKDEIVTVSLFDPDGKMLAFSDDLSERQREIAPPANYANKRGWLINWWNERAVPLTRDHILEFLKKEGYRARTEYLLKNLGLSMTDYYWIKPLDSDLTWETVSPFTNPFRNDIFLPAQTLYDDSSLYSPNSALQGNLEKAWTILNGERYLVKGNHLQFSSESLNEIIASEIHRRQGYDNYTPYRLIRIKGKPYNYGCMSKAFADENRELISAWQVCSLKSKDNNTSYYEHFIRVATEHGIDAEQLRRDLEYQIMVDFVMSGYDRHLTNVGVLRDSETLRYIRMAPIYDSGGSLFATRPFPGSLRELEHMEVTSFSSRESKLLDLVRDRSLLDRTKLPSADYIREIYSRDSQIPKETILHVAEWYERKLDMLRDFQLGLDPFFKKNISMFSADEKRRPDKFILISGITGSGKTKNAAEIAAELKESGFREVVYQALFNRRPDQILESVWEDNSSITLLKNVPQHAFVRLSANDIRDLLIEHNRYPDNESVFSIVDHLIETALKNGISVIYEATNATNETRERYLKIAKDCGTKENVLVVCKSDIPSASIARPDIDVSQIERIAGQISEAAKDNATEWDTVIDANIQMLMMMKYSKDCMD